MEKLRKKPVIAFVALFAALYVIIYVIPRVTGTLKFSYILNNRLGEIVVPVKMPVTRSRTERPHGALL